MKLPNNGRIRERILFENKNIALALEENAIRRGPHPAIIEGAKTITYQELDPMVRRVAGHLADQGVGEGSIIGVGAAVVKDVDPGSTVVGVPAKPI